MNEVVVSIFTFCLFRFSAKSLKMLPGCTRSPHHDCPAIREPHSAAMDTITSHHLLAKILTSLTERQEELSLATHVAQQLQGPGNEGEKAVLAEVLVALLPKCQDVPYLPIKKFAT